MKNFFRQVSLNASFLLKLQLNQSKNKIASQLNAVDAQQTVLWILS